MSVVKYKDFHLTLKNSKVEARLYNATSHDVGDKTTVSDGDGKHHVGHNNNAVYFAHNKADVFDNTKYEFYVKCRDNTPKHEFDEFDNAIVVTCTTEVEWFLS